MPSDNTKDLTMHMKRKVLQQTAREQAAVVDSLTADQLREMGSNLMKSATLKELAELRRLGLFDDRLHERARAIVRDQAQDWEGLSTSEAADLALDLARAVPVMKTRSRTVRVDADVSAALKTIDSKPNRAVAALLRDALTPERLAVEFARVLRGWLTVEQIDEVVKRNATAAYAGCCASHDFCDANVAMLEAWTRLTGKPEAEYDPGNERLCETFNRAWGIARASKFAVRS